MRRISAQIAIVVGACTVAVASLVGGCKTESNPTSTAPALSRNTQVQGLPKTPPPAPQPTMSGAPIPIEQVEAAVNPTKLPAYTGPTGIIEGTVRIKGDPAPEVPLKIPPACKGAEQTYGRLFREGDNRTAADVLIAVTGFKGYVPETEETVTLTIDKCAYSTRTIAMTFGQHLEVKNLDAKNSFIPVLQGSRFTAYMVAVPKGSPVKLYPHRVGQYELVDNMNRPWMSADTFVLKYATHVVTGLDGHFRLEGIPAGEVTVNALLPAINATQGKKITVKAGETVKVDFVITFDKTKVDGKTSPRPIVPPGDSSTPVVPPVK
jgi:hypothetical protein